MKKKSLLKIILTLTIGLIVLSFHLAQGNPCAAYPNACGGSDVEDYGYSPPTNQANQKTAILGTWELVSFSCENGISLFEKQLAKAQSIINSGLERTFDGNVVGGTILTRATYLSRFSSETCPVYVESNYSFTGDSLIIQNSEININGCWATSFIRFFLSIRNEAPEVLYYNFRVNGNTLYLLLTPPIIKCGKNVRVVEEYKRVVE